MQKTNNSSSCETFQLKKLYNHNFMHIEIKNNFLLHKNKNM